MKYFPREIGSVLRLAVREYRVVGLTGARQTGKSTLLRHLFSKTHQYLSFDDQKTLQFAKSRPEEFLAQYDRPLILDEFQYAPELLPYIKMRVDRQNKKGMYILTGSQQFLMMKSLQETLAGRIVLLQLLPIAITEGHSRRAGFAERVLCGSYPETILQKLTNPETWLSAYFSTYVERDIQPHYRLEKIAQFKNLVALLAARVGQVLNYNSLAGDLGVSLLAVKSWIQILEASQIIYLLRPYYVNLGSRIIKSPKVYFTDVGLANYFLGIRDVRSLMKNQQAGFLFENFVIQELLKYYCNRGEIPPLFYYRTNNGLEIDLLIEQGVGKILPVEIKLAEIPKDSTLNNFERLTALNRTKKIKIKEPSVICSARGKFALNKNVMAYSLPEFLKNLPR